jgi:hypothetical protein
MSDRRGGRPHAPLHSISLGAPSNGERPSGRPAAKSSTETERATNVRLAIYFPAIALVLFLTDWLSEQSGRPFRA